jgi:hypothetical protein
MNQDRLNKLQQLAINNTSSPSNMYSLVTEQTVDAFNNKIKRFKDKATQMFPNNKEKAFETWYNNTKDLVFPNNKAKENYWSMYYSLNPKEKTEIQDEILDNIEQELKFIDTPNEKEHFLRDKISKLPSFFEDEYKDYLQQLSARNANTNLNKAYQFYKDDLSNRLSKLSYKELDPDVSKDEHIKDLLKLEKMNLLDVSEAANGRFGVVGKDGKFIPAFDIEDRNNIFPNDKSSSPLLSEQLAIDDLATDFLNKYVDGNIAFQRNKIKTDNAETENIARRLLQTGSLKPEKWNEAFSMFSKPNYQDLITMGLQGEMESGRIKSDEDIVKTLYSTIAEYKDIFNNIEKVEETNNPYYSILNMDKTTEEEN